MQRIKKMKGFTLIELIVVVIIIGVLAAIAAVAYNQFIGNSRSTALTATATQADKAIQAVTAQDDAVVSATQVTKAQASVKNATLSISGTPSATSVKVEVVPSQGTRGACLTYTPSAGATAVTPGAAATITYGLSADAAFCA